MSAAATISPYSLTEVCLKNKKPPLRGLFGSCSSSAIHQAYRWPGQELASRLTPIVRRTFMLPARLNHGYRPFLKLLIQHKNTHSAQVFPRMRGTRDAATDWPYPEQQAQQFGQVSALLPDCPTDGVVAQSGLIAVITIPLVVAIAVFTSPVKVPPLMIAIPAMFVFKAPAIAFPGTYKVP